MVSLPPHRYHAAYTGGHWNRSWFKDNKLILGFLHKVRSRNSLTSPLTSPTICTESTEHWQCRMIASAGSIHPRMNCPLGDSNYCVRTFVSPTRLAGYESVYRMADTAGWYCTAGNIVLWIRSPWLVILDANRLVCRIRRSSFQNRKLNF